MFAKTCIGMTIMRTFFSRSFRNGFKKLHPVPMRTTTVNNISPRTDVKK